MNKLAATLALALATPAYADTLGPYTDLLVFGDSLSDPGNVYAATGNSFPPAPYFEGQFSNGDTWASLLGADIGSGTNFAYGGATALQTTQDGLDIPDFIDQRALYEASGVELGDNPLTAVWFGGNDLRVLLSPEGAGIDPSTLIGDVVTEIVTGIIDLSSTQLDDFLVFGLPDFGVIPGVNQDAELSAVASGLSTAFNTALSQTLTFVFGGSPTNVSFFDTQGFFADLLLEADTLGITNTTDACLVADNDETPEINEAFFCGLVTDPSTYAFFDGLHPTAPIHAALAAELRSTPSPVPLPGSVAFALGGLVLLGGVARRRKVAGA